MPNVSFFYKLIENNVMHSFTQPSEAFDREEA